MGDSNILIMGDSNILIMGDSNICKLPLIHSDQTQIEAYPGALIEHATGMIKLLLPKGESLVTKLILSFGLNNRERHPTSPTSTTRPP
jgi:hypothetical protein